MTNSLLRRVAQHREGTAGRFTKRYNVHNLVWYEPYQFIEDAIQREKSIKRWPRQWKINLIEHENPHWQDLYVGLQAKWSLAGDAADGKVGSSDSGVTVEAFKSSDDEEE